MSHRNKNAMDWTPASRPDVAGAIDRIPAGIFLLTSAYGDQRGGVAVKWVQQCCNIPPMLMVAVEKGHSLSPVIRDSRAFALCQLDPADRAALRSFEQQQPGIDPFVGVLCTAAPSGAPVPCRALAFSDCELARHVDIDGDHEIYVGVVHHATLLRESTHADHCLCEHAARVRAAVAARSAMATPAPAHRDESRHAKVSPNGTRRNGTLRQAARVSAARETAGKLGASRKRK